MENIENLIAALKLGIPELNPAPLYADQPENIDDYRIVDWLYKHLEAQKLITHEKWNEYNGFIPELKPLAHLPIAEDPADFIFTLLEKIDWSTANLEPDMLPYVLPWLEHINHYLQPHGVRLVDLLPFEEAYILCIRDDDEVLKKLQSSLAKFAVDINPRHPMDQQQVSADIEAMLYE